MKKVIVVTGGAGFIGSNLIKHLAVKTKLQIISIDNYSSGNYYIRVYSQSGGVINSKFIKK